MATAALRRAMTAFTRPPDPSDAELLRQFAGRRCEAAFAALVRRHGPLVLGVCRRVVPDAHLADDAFQAAFVVLARRAGGIDPTRPLGPWLYGVAHRVALRARTMLGKRRTRETLTAAVPEMPVPGGTDFPAGDFDTAAVLDEEIAKLPPASRDAVILCELQGMSRRDAAARLGVAEGTLSSRLAAARKTLAARLRARGVVLSAALAGAAVVSPQLATAAVAAGIGASLSSVVTSLADGASAMTLLNKLKLTAVAVLFLLLSAGGVGPWRANETAAAPVPKELKADGGLIWLRDYARDELVAYTPDGEKAERVKLPADQMFLRVTPDGSQILYVPKAARELKEGVKTTYHLRPFGEHTRGTDTGIPYRMGTVILSWTRDGTRFLRCLEDGVHRDDNYEVVDLTAKTVSTVKVPRDYHPVSWTPDETQFLAVGPGDWLDKHQRVCLLASGVTPVELKLNTRASVIHPAHVHDGKALLFHGQRYDPPADPKGPDYHAVFRLDPTTGKLTEVLHEAGQDYSHATPSPDAARVAVLWCYRADPTAKELDRVNLSVMKADGTGRSTFTVRDKAKGDDLGHFSGYDLLGWFPRQINAPVPKQKDGGGLVWVHDRAARELVGYSPEGTVKHTLELSDHLPDGAKAVGITRDGRRAIFTVGSGKGGTPPYTLHLLPLFEPGKAVDTKIAFDGRDHIHLSPDGKTITLERVVRPAAPARNADTDAVVVQTRYDLTTFKEVAVPEPKGIPKGYHFRHEFTNGDRLISRSDPLGSTRSSYYLLPADGGKRKLVTGDHEVERCSVSPDGGTLLVTVHPTVRTKHSEPSRTVYLIDRATGEEKQIAAHPFLSSIDPLWSPDGMRVAYRWYESGHPDDRRGRDGLTPIIRGEVVVCDADGGNPVVLKKLDGTLEEDITRRILWTADQPVLVGWAPTPQKIKAPVPKGKSAGLIWTHTVSTSTLTAYTPDGKEAKAVKLPEASRVFRGFTPDGTRMAFIRKGDNGLSLQLGPIDDSGTGTDTGLGCEAGDEFVFSPDAKRVVRVRTEGVGNRPLIQHSHVLFDLATKKQTKLDLAADHQIMRWSADGKTWGILHNNLGQNPKLPGFRWLTAAVADMPDPKPVCDTHVLLWLEPTADNKGWLGGGWKYERDGRTRVFGLHAVTDGQATEVARMEGVVFANFRRSPDGTRVVCAKAEYDPKTQKLGDTVFVLFDADGKSESKLLTIENDVQNTRLVGWFPTPADPKGK